MHGAVFVMHGWLMLVTNEMNYSNVLFQLQPGKTQTFSHLFHTTTDPLILSLSHCSLSELTTTQYVN